MRIDSPVKTAVSRQKKRTTRKSDATILEPDRGGDDGTGETETEAGRGQHRNQKTQVFAEENPPPRYRLRGENSPDTPGGLRN